MKTLSLVRSLLASLVLLPALSAQAETDPPVGLKSGPMLGHNAMTEVWIWVQTTEPASVTARYWPKGESAGSAGRLTESVQTTARDAGVAVLRASQLRPGETYGYEILVNGQVVSPQFRAGYGESGPIPMQFTARPNWRFREGGHQVFDFRVAAGSCAYINDPEHGLDRQSSPPYGAEYGIFERIHESSPDLMIWLGDSIYLREPDWETREGILYRWSHGRALPEMRALLANTHHYAIWDDHDYGPNNAGWGFPQKHWALEAFNLFWANPSAGLPDLPGTFTQFNWGDVNFYLLDNRFHRDSDGGDPAPFGRWKQHHGKPQVEWLIEQLQWARTQSRSSYPISFQVVCTGSQVLSDNPYPENYRTYRHEWEYFMDRILHERIEGLVFLTGDVHYTELSREVRTGGGLPGTPGQAGPRGHSLLLYDLTVSPLTSGTHRRPTPTSLSVPSPNSEDGAIRVRNFALLDFAGPLEDRTLTLRVIDSEGRLLNADPDGDGTTVPDTWVIRAQDLKLSR